MTKQHPPTFTALVLVIAILVLSIALLGTRDARAASDAYDTDADGLIEVSTLEQLDALRYDLNGNGNPDDPSAGAAYAAAFPDAEPGAFCPDGCSGYELTRDLDFQDADSYASNEINAAWVDRLAGGLTEGKGWWPIGSVDDPFATGHFDTVFDGNGHSVSNLYIERASTSTYINHVGLFSAVGRHGIVRNVGLIDIDIRSRGHWVGGLAGDNRGVIFSSYTTGSVSGDIGVGGLIGYNGRGGIINVSYANVSVSGMQNVGGLVGINDGGGTLGDTYIVEDIEEVSSVESLARLPAFGGRTATISVSYATGSVSGTENIAGLVGYNGRGGIIGDTYATGGGLVGDNRGVIDSSYARGRVGIDSEWGDVWDFGTSSQYPALKADFDGDGIATWQEFGSQIRNASERAAATPTPTPTAAPTITPTPTVAPTPVPAAPTAIPTPEREGDGGSCNSVSAIYPISAAAGNVLLFLAPLAMIGGIKFVGRRRRATGWD